MPIISRNALKIAALATTHDDSRYNLKTVRVEPDGRCVATDGHMLIIARDTLTTPDADFPMVPGLPENLNGSAGAVHVPVDVVTRLIKAMPTKSPIPVLTMARIGVTPEGDAYAAATDLSVRAIAKLEPNGSFPQYEKVMVQDGARPDVIKVAIAANILERLAKIGKLAGRGECCVTLEIPTAARHFVKETRILVDSFRFTAGAGDTTVEGAAMPCRVMDRGEDE